MRVGADPADAGSGPVVLGVRVPHVGVPHRRLPPPPPQENPSAPEEERERERELVRRVAAAGGRA